MITKENGGTSKRFAKKFLALRFEHFVQRMQNDPKELRSRYPEWIAGVTDKEYARICDGANRLMNTMKRCNLHCTEKDD